jgi:hypothetical protein
MLQDLQQPHIYTSLLYFHHQSWDISAAMASAFHRLVSFFFAISVFTSSVAGVYVKYCEHANFGGKCKKITPNVNECHNVPSDLNDKVSQLLEEPFQHLANLTLIML